MNYDTGEVMKKGFTLAEIMIVLAVIGVLTAILLPVAINSTPNENVMKFKKGHNALLSAIRELVNSDKYYLDGDLGKKPDGSYVLSSSYFCDTLAEIINTKEKNCDKLSEVDTDATNHFIDVGGDNDDMHGVSNIPLKYAFDNACEYYNPGKINELVTSDDIVYYQTWPNTPFGQNTPSGVDCADIAENCDKPIFYRKTPKGFLKNYTVICMDIDGVPEDADDDNCVNECPFGYGIRVDGKVSLGARAQEWLQKSIQKGD